MHMSESKSGGTYGIMVPIAYACSESSDEPVQTQSRKGICTARTKK